MSQTKARRFGHGDVLGDPNTLPPLAHSASSPSSLHGLQHQLRQHPQHPYYQQSKRFGSEEASAAAPAAPLSPQLSPSMPIKRSLTSPRLVVAENKLPGQLAARWGRKLPAVPAALEPRNVAVVECLLSRAGLGNSTPGSFIPIGTDEAVTLVQAHLAEMQEHIRLRQPTMLESALSRTQGSRYLKAAQALRKSRKTSDMHKHALESAMATHIVKAKSKLGKWKVGVQDIKEACRLRDAECVEAQLQAWGFAEDDPVVIAARRDLDRWARLSEDLPHQLQDGVECRDIPKLKAAFRHLSSGGPRLGAEHTETVSKARALLSCHEAQETALTQAIAGNRAVDAEKAIAAWEFDLQDPLLSKGRELLEKRDRLRAKLRSATNAKPPDGAQLEEACSLWEFEEDDDDFIGASLLVARFHEALKEIEELVALCNTAKAATSPSKRARQRKSDLPGLRARVDAWEFAEGPESGCPAMVAARDLLKAFEDEVQVAVNSKDGWLLHRYWTQLGTSLPIAGSGLAAAVVELLDARSKAAGELQLCLRDATGFEATYAPEVERQYKAWSLVSTDPIVVEANQWLRIWKSLVKRSTTELAVSVEARNDVAVRGVLARCQGLAHNDDVVCSAMELLETSNEANNVASWLFLGTPAVARAETSAPTAAPVDVGNEGASTDVGEDHVTTDQHTSGADDDNAAGGRDLDVSRSGTFEVWPEISTLPSLEDACHSLIAALPGDPVTVAAWRACGCDSDELEVFVELSKRHVQRAKSDLKAAHSRLKSFLRTPLGRVSTAAPFIDRMQACRDNLEEIRCPGFSWPIAVSEAVTYVLANTTVVSAPIGANGLIQRMKSALETLEGLVAEVNAQLEPGIEDPAGLVEGLLACGLGPSLRCRPADPPLKEPPKWQLRMELPLEAFAAARRTMDFLSASTARPATPLLGARPRTTDPNIAPAVDFLALVRAFHEEFVPLCAALASAAMATEEASGALQRMEILVEGFAAADGSVLGDIESIGATCPALVVENAQIAARKTLDAHFAEPPSYDADDAERLRWTLEAFKICLDPVRRFASDLAALAETIQPEELITCSDADLAPEQSGEPQNLSRAEVLLAAADAVIRNMDGNSGQQAQDETSFRQRVADSEGFKQLLVNWSPFAADFGQLENLTSAGQTLVDFWSWYVDGCEGDVHSCRLFIWITLACALLPHLNVARQIAPVEGEIRAAAAALETGGVEAAVAWSNARNALHRSEAPWWWLQLLGCPDAEDFYVNYRFAKDDPAAANNANVSDGASPQASPTSPAPDSGFEFSNEDSAAAAASFAKNDEGDVEAFEPNNVREEAVGAMAEEAEAEAKPIEADEEGEFKDEAVADESAKQPTGNETVEVELEKPDAEEGNRAPDFLSNDNPEAPPG